VQLLSSLLPEEAILVRTDQKISVVTVEKEIRSRTIWSHCAHGNQNIGQTDTLALPSVRKYPWIHHTIHFLSSNFHCCEGQILSCMQDDLVSAQCIQTASKLEPIHDKLFNPSSCEQATYKIGQYKHYTTQISLVYTACRYYQCRQTRVGYDDLIMRNTCKNRQVRVTSTENQEGSHMGDS
jgi:hypothetical protein